MIFVMDFRFYDFLGLWFGVGSSETEYGLADEGSRVYVYVIDRRVGMMSTYGKYIQ